jgi:peptide/nickel transport system ATP-binding protein
MLEVRNLTIELKRRQKYYTAVDGIDITINAGEIVALAGESGSGKSLSALSIARLLPPAAHISGGTIQYSTASGETVNLCSLGEKSLRQIRGNEITMIFQEPRQSLNPLMRVGSQIAETLELHGTDQKTANETAHDLLQKLQFPEPEKIFNAWPHQLSGGMCQRVMIAIAAICRPRLLIADEPITALDTANQHHILSLLKHINSEFDTAILFISHDLSVVRHFCSRLMVMYAGKIIEEGPAEAILSAPLHPYTIGLVGAVPRKENKGRPLANISGKAPSLEEKLSGCLFAPRCPRLLEKPWLLKEPQARERCTTAIPPWVDIGGDHRVCCIYPEYKNGPGANNG